MNGTEKVVSNNYIKKSGLKPELHHHLLILVTRVTKND